MAIVRDVDSTGPVRDNTVQHTYPCLHNIPFRVIHSTRFVVSSRLRISLRRYLDRK